VRAGGDWLVRRRVTGTTENGAAKTPGTTPERSTGKTSKKTPEMDPHELGVLLYPPFRVTSEGAFGGLELTPADRAILERRQAQQRQRVEMIKKLAPSVPLAPVEDVQAATRTAASSWNYLVGGWAGKTLAEGLPGRQTESDMVVPPLGPLHLVDRLTLTRGVPCKPAPRDGCVALEVTSESADATSATADKGRFRATQTLVTDPRTLIPRSFTRTVQASAPVAPEVAKAAGAPAWTREDTNSVETMTFRCK
jgi:hypothetical protein